METQASISTWAKETFGEPTSLELVVDRFLEEVEELQTGAPEDLPDECADCMIVLLQVAATAGFDLQEAIDAKMKINRARKWNTKGDGVGQHID